MLSILFAFASAFTSALNLVTQHVASTAAPAKDKGWRLALYLVRNPLWLFGVGAIVGSFAFQAFALYEGRISVVQSILVTELVFSLVIGRVWLRRHVAPAAWASASVTAVGLAVFLVMSEPKRGPPAGDGGGVVTGLAHVRRGRRRSGPTGRPRFTTATGGALCLIGRADISGHGHILEIDRRRFR